MWSREAPAGPIAPRTPGLIWVLGLEAGDVMVDRSIRRERLRPLGLWWTAALGRVSRKAAGASRWGRRGRNGVVASDQPRSCRMWPS